MNKVLIIGAGSIGNHLAYACRQKNLHVSIYDIDEPALLRTKKMIYPSRYGEWDTQIKLLNEFPQTEKYNIVIIGTPPDSHLSIASKVLQEIKPNVILIEKPLCPPGMKGLETLKGIRAKSNTTVLVGYNHNLTANTKFVENLLDEVFLGIPLSMHVRWLEYWGGIFEAHPWLDGPKDSYLGFSERGGGACAEHSHAEKTPYFKINGKASNIIIGDNVKFVGRVDIRNRENGKILIGDNCKIDHEVRMVAANNAVLSIGANTNIGCFSVLNCGEDIIIGQGCLISGMAYIQSSDHGKNIGIPIKAQKHEYGKINIGDDVWVGSHVTILKGVNIDDGVIIGAKSVVTKNVSANYIIAGVPAKKIKIRK